MKRRYQEERKNQDIKERNLSRSRIVKSYMKLKIRKSSTDPNFKVFLTTLSNYPNIYTIICEQ